MRCDGRCDDTLECLLEAAQRLFVGPRTFRYLPRLDIPQSSRVKAIRDYCSFHQCSFLSAATPSPLSLDSSTLLPTPILHLQHHYYRTTYRPFISCVARQPALAMCPSTWDLRSTKISRRSSRSARFEYFFTMETLQRCSSTVTNQR